MIGFWAWFSAHHERLRALSPAEAVGEIEDRVRAIDPRISLELGDDRDRHLIFTALAEVALFPVIKELVAAAPALPRWRFTALKPAGGFAFELDAAGRRINAGELTFESLEAAKLPGALGLRVFVDAELAAHPEIHGLIFMIVATGIGEEAAAKIAHLEVAAVGRAPAKPLKLAGLAEFIAWHGRTKLN